MVEPSTWMRAAPATVLDASRWASRRPRRHITRAVALRAMHRAPRSSSEQSPAGARSRMFLVASAAT
eukprot:4047291-Pyramimonas_sp.AAC.1